MPIIQSDRLAGRVYHDMARELSKLQQEIILHDALIDRFGAKAMPTHDLMRNSRDMITKGTTATMNRIRQHSEERIAELVETMAMFEAVFADQEAADFEAFADYIRKTYGKAQRKPGKAVAK